ncbi:MAG: hypothetical protein U0359_30655, partial [Byssovorax sp.]
MKIDVLSPRATRAKLSPGRVRLAWRCTGPGGAHQVDRFEVRVLSLERRRMRLPDDARAFSAAHFFQWLLDRTGPHGTVTSRTEVVTVPEISLDLGPDRIHACRISAPSSPEIQAAVVVFFTKPIRNYLRARLERRRPREGDAPRPAAPLVPLLCLELDR